MENWIIDVMGKFGYIGVFFLIALENIFPPIPSEVILTFGGFMTAHTELTIMGVVWFATLGSVLGAVILYGVGYTLNLDKLEIFISRWGHLFRLKVDDIYKANEWFTKYGGWTVLFCRFIPLIRSLISIPAGMTKMNFTLFFFLTTLGTFIWNLVLVYVGAFFGDSWHEVVGFMDMFSTIIYAGLAIILIVVAVLFIKKRIL